VIEQRHHIRRRIGMTKGACRILGSPMPSQVGHNHLKVFAPPSGERCPIGARSAEPVQQENRLALPVHFKMQINAVERFRTASHVGVTY